MDAGQVDFFFVQVGDMAEQPGFGLGPGEGTVVARAFLHFLDESVEGAGERFFPLLRRDQQVHFGIVKMIDSNLSPEQGKEARRDPGADDQEREGERSCGERRGCPARVHQRKTGRQGAGTDQDDACIQDAHDADSDQRHGKNGKADPEQKGEPFQENHPKLLRLGDHHPTG